MSRRRTLSRGAATFLTMLLLAGLVLVSGGVLGKFSATGANPSNLVTAAADYVGPSATASVIAKAEGGTPGFVRSGGGYYVYAELADSGNPPSGVATAEAGSGGIIVSLLAGSFSFDGVSYNRRSSQQTLPFVGEGTYAYTIDMTDQAGNGSSNGGFQVTIDNTDPRGSSVTTANGGSITGRPEQNDRITFTYSEPIEPDSILSGWDGGQTNVVVRINNNAVSFRDQLLVFNSGNSTQLPLGSVDLGRSDYVSANRTFGAGGTASKMTMSGNSVTVVLGTASGFTTTAAGSGTMSWAPSSVPIDRAGNSTSTSAVTEGGSSDREF